MAVIERSILATDLALHFRDAPALSALASAVQSQDHLKMLLAEKSENKALLQSGLMTAADLGAVTKPWNIHKHVSALIAEEFWTQGDIERRCTITKAQKKLKYDRTGRSAKCVTHSL